jgi:hypothetical protein
VYVELTASPVIPVLQTLPVQTGEEADSPLAVKVDPVLGVHKTLYEVRAAPPSKAGAVHAAFTAPDVPVFAVKVPIVGGLGTELGMTIPVTAVV